MRVDLLKNYPKLESCWESVQEALDCLAESFKADGKLMVMGNGGSSADAEHICAELTKGNFLRRELHHKEKDLFGNDIAILPKMLQNGLSAISLSSSHSFVTAFMNDVHPEFIFAQQIWVHGKENDVVLALSTSGNSRNIIAGLHTARAKKIKTILLTGGSENRGKGLADITIAVPEFEVHRIQELHLPIYHYLCFELEHIFFDVAEGHHYKKHN
ncbi:MAG: SIS domain-containing protein [Patescibacteria group bacterium]